MTDKRYSIRTEVMTPEKAGAILANVSEHQRNLNKATVDRYASDMAEGRWSEDCPQDNICIGSDGKLLNGMHRLAAVVESGKPVAMTVARNVPPGEIEHMDEGRSRKAAQFLDIPNASHVASLARAVNAFKREQSISLATAMGQATVSRAAVIAEARENGDELLRAVRQGMRLRGANGVGSTLAYSLACWTVEKVRKGFDADKACQDVSDLSTQNAAYFSRAITKAFTDKSKPKPAFVLGATIQYLASCASGSKCLRYSSTDKHVERYSKMLHEVIQ